MLFKRRLSQYVGTYSCNISAICQFIGRECQITNSVYAQNTHNMIQKGLTKAVSGEKLSITAIGIIGRCWLKSLADGFLLCISYANEWSESVETIEDRGEQKF